MNSHELRKKFIEYLGQKPRNHKEIPNLSLIPDGDSTLLFVNSGMFPLVPYLSGEVDHPLGKRICNIQRCVRADGILDDIEEVGDARHLTLFEMVGNWSLGDYFKKEQLRNWYKFLVEEIGLEPKRLYQSVYAGDDKIEKDEESVKTLKETFRDYEIEAEVGPETIGEKEEKGPGVPIDFEKYRIFPYQKKCWWQRGDAPGELGGPDSETFYDTGIPHDPKYGLYCHINCDCGRFLEIGNSVFMQYQLDKDKKWQELKNKNVDFGGGFERILAVANGYDDIFQTDVFKNIIVKLEELSNSEYGDKSDNEYIYEGKDEIVHRRKYFRVIADHIRASVFLIADGVLPSNKDQGYVLRRLIRRAVRIGRKMDINQNFLNQLVNEVVDIFKDESSYNHLDKERSNILEVIDQEETKFRKTLDKGLKEFEKFYKKAEVSWIDKKGKNEQEALKKLMHKQGILPGEIAFRLYETYGFPIEMIEEEAGNRNLKVDRKGFEKAQKAHRAKSRAGSKKKFTSGLADSSKEVTRLHTATHLMHAALRRVLGDHVQQKGSNITAERLRFDFNFERKMTDEEKKKVEDLVNEQIKKKIDVTREEMTVTEAKKKGATGLFDAKYGDQVSVYTIKGFSKEICSGPHVSNTGKLGKFKIVKEESAGAGIRRIKAVLE